MAPKAEDDLVRVRCPYCSRYFGVRRRPVPEGQRRISLKCPLCGEQVAVPSEGVALPEDEKTFSL